MATKNNASGRAPKGQGSVRQRPDGTYEGRTTINGVRKSFYGEKQGDVIKAMRTAKRAEEIGVYFEPTRLSVEKWIDTWIEEYVEPSVKPLTLAAYRSQSRIHIKPVLGKIKLAKLDSTQIQKLYNDMIREEGLSPKTVKNVHGILHKALVKAVQLRYIGFNPADACTLPRVEKQEIKPLTHEEMKAFLKVIEADAEYKDVLAVTLFTGMREGEVCGLPWDAVNFDAGTITIKQQLLKEKNKKGAKCYIASTKNDRSRVITPAPYVMELLRDVRRRQNEMRLKAGRAWDNKWNLVFTNALGRHLFPQMAYQHFKRAAAKLGRPDARFHDLRHTYAVTALQEGDDIKTVQANLGHATASFTLDVYGHVSEKMKQDSAARMEAYIRQLKGQ